MLRSAHTVYLCVLCGSEIKQQIFSYTAVNDWFYNQDWECLLRGTDSIFKCNSSSVWFSEQLVARLSRRRPGFGSRSVPVRFVVYKLAMEQLFLQDLGFVLSVSFHHCSIPIFVYMLLLPEGQMGEAWEPWRKQWSFGHRVILDRKYSHSVKPSKCC